MIVRPPHPIPYQGSKRALAPAIAPHLPTNIDRWFEPFAGSAAMTLYAAHHVLARRFVLNDASQDLANLWTAIVGDPESTAALYRDIWQAHAAAGPAHFNTVRARFNARRDPVDLLYLVCRCVKNAVRFNRDGDFTQSPDKRRLGMSPARMAAAIEGASGLLRDKTEVRTGDWLAEGLRGAEPQDFIYLDPPYLGTSLGRDKRYAAQLAPDQLIAGLEALLSRNLRFALSYDGSTGEKSYGPPLPAHLGLTRILLPAGRSSQSTLSGRAEQTVESLYLSPGLF